MYGGIDKKIDEDIWETTNGHHNKDVELGRNLKFKVTNRNKVKADIIKIILTADGKDYPYCNGKSEMFHLSQKYNSRFFSFYL